MKTSWSLACGILATLLAITPVRAAVIVELTSNGDFESGNTSGWVSFPSGSSTFEAISSPASDVFAGNFTGKIVNTSEGQAAIIKQANLGVGVVQSFQEITISFWAKGSGTAGGVQFAEFFSELSGGGTSKSEILGGTPLFLGNDYAFYSFNAITGGDVSGGVTLQLNAATGANPGSTSTFFVDNVSVSYVSAVPEPASIAMLGVAGTIALLRRRRARR